MNKQFYTQSFKDEVAAREKPINTINLQLDSLIIFMHQLGYNFKPSKIKGLSGFYAPKSTISLYKYFPKHISFQDAIRLHNGNVLFKIHRGHFVDVMNLGYKFIIPWTLYQSAHNSRLVHEVKLQKLKKAPYVKAQSHYVKLLEG